MRKAILVFALVGIFGISFVYADTTTGNLAVRAVIGASTPDMGFKIVRTQDGDINQDAWDNGVLVSDLTFDQWEVVQRPGRAAQWTAATQNTIFVYATGRGDDYQILADGTGALTGPGGTLPAASFMAAYIYAPQDQWKIDFNGDGDTNDPGETFAQGAAPTGATGAAITKEKGTILGVSNKIVYSSESLVGSSRIVQIKLMFPSYDGAGAAPFTGYAPIPSTTAAGLYTGGNVVVRIVAK